MNGWLEALGKEAAAAAADLVWLSVQPSGAERLTCLVKRRGSGWAELGMGGSSTLVSLGSHYINRHVTSSRDGNRRTEGTT